MLHGGHGALTVLHHIADDTKLVKVATSPFSSKRFLESDLAANSALHDES